MNEEVKEIEPVSVTGYVFIFSAIYAGLMVLVQILVHAFDIDLGSGANSGMLVGAGLGAMMKFVNDHKRPPIKSEKRRLIWLSILSCFGVSVLVGAIALFIVGGSAAFSEISELVGTLPIAAWVGILFGVTILYYVMLRINYGWGARFYYKRLDKG